jgi:hypothetical protein
MEHRSARLEKRLCVSFREVLDPGGSQTINTGKNQPSAGPQTEYFAANELSKNCDFKKLFGLT